MILSIVTGTYNRLSYLQRMVETARQSMGKGLEYEFVLVDGGSKDGTIEWCKSQLDIRLIEQGELLGAVKAFNAGAYAAKGDYVILANDDIEFIDESILCAVRFMQDSPGVGIGCFYQDRYGKSWYVDIMTALMPNGVSTNVYYGQVCIVPKWLGDKVGWWGDYLHTYGGDNELSCNVIEQGYRIQPVPCACIHDLMPDDELRRINSEYSQALSQHPDTQMWLAKWSREHKKFGPIIKSKPIEDNPILRRLRILYAPIYEPGYPIQKLQKCGLRKALSRYGLVTEVDYMADGIGKIFDVASAWHPDLFVMQLQDADTFPMEEMRLLRQEHKDSTFVNWNGDYHPDNLYDARYILLLKEFDITGLVTTTVKQIYDANKINWFYWQIGFEESNAMPDKFTPKHDIVFLANGYSGERMELAKFLRSLPYNVGIYGSWPSEVKPNGTNLYDFDEGQKLYMNAKIAIGDSQWPEATGFVSNRLFQAMATGSLLLQQWFDGAEDLLGLKHKEHLIYWKSIDELNQYLHHCMDPDNKFKIAEVAVYGEDYVKKHHSFNARVDELFSRLEIKYAMG